MAGNFARGFMQTFGPTLQNTQSRKDDLFRNFYKQFSDKQEKRQEYAAKERQAVSQARLIAQELGLPEGAWKEISKDFIMGSGMDYKEAKEAAKNFKWNPTDLPAGQTTPDSPSQMETQEQMRQSGLSPEQMDPQGTAPQTPQEAPTGGIPQPIVSGLNRMKEAFKGRDMDSVMRRMEQETGLPRAQIEIIMAQNPEAMEPLGDTGKIMAQAQGYTKEPKTGGDFNIPNEDRLKFEADTIKQLKEPVRSYRAAKVAGLSVINDVSDMTKIVQETPAVLADGVSWFAQFVSGVRQNFEAGKGLITGDDRSNQIMSKVVESKDKDGNVDPAVLQSALDLTEKEYNLLYENSIANKTIDLATARTLFDMKTKLLAYKLGIMYQQEGRSFSDAEREMMIQIATGGDSPEKFFQNMAVLLDGEFTRVETARQEILGAPELQLYKQRFGEDLPIDITGPSIQEEIENNPKYKETMDFLGQYNDTSVKAKGQVQEPAANSGGWVIEEVTQ